VFETKEGRKEESKEGMKCGRKKQIKERREEEKNVVKEGTGLYYQIFQNAALNWILRYKTKVYRTRSFFTSKSIHRYGGRLFYRLLETLNSAEYNLWKNKSGRR